jgi:hypothetical protein
MKVKAYAVFAAASMTKKKLLMLMSKVNVQNFLYLSLTKGKNGEAPAYFTEASVTKIIKLFNR